MATEMFTQLPTVSAATLADITCAVQGGNSVQETWQQVLNLFQTNITQVGTITVGVWDAGSVTSPMGALTSGSPSGGFTGDLTLYPITANTGSLSMQATSNSGNFSLLITNAPFSQATILTIPDPTISNARFILSATGGGETQTITQGSLQVTDGGFVAGAIGGSEAGSLKLFSSSAALGTLIWQAANNAGNFQIECTNASFSQSSILTIPDPGQSTANFTLSPSALVSNNFTQASGTSGLIKDSGWGTVTITLTASQVNSAFATPVQLIAAPGAGKTIMVLQTYQAVNSTGNTPFANGGVGVIQYGNTIHGAGENAVETTIPVACITNAANTVGVTRGLANNAGAGSTGMSNSGIFFSNQTQAYTAGTGTTIAITLLYAIIASAN